MSKSLLLAVGIMAAIALLVWFFTSSPSALKDAVDTTATTSAETVPASAAPTKAPAKPAGGAAQGVPNPNTYKSLLTQTGSYQCDYDQVQSTGKSHNVIYIYGGKMRGEFRTDASGVSNSNLFVYDGHYMYQWKEGSSVGTRTVLTSLSQLPLVIPKDLTSGAIVGGSYESVGWLCHSWLTNKALLAPPSYVSFTG